MEIKLEIPLYTIEKGIKYNWVNGFDIETNVKNDIIYIVANKEGLISLASHLLNLAQEGVPSGHHLHFDENNSLKEGSVTLIIQKRY